MGIGVGVLVLARKEFEKFNLWLAAVGKMKRQAGRQTETPRGEGGRQGQTSLGLRSSSPIRLLSVLYVRLPLRRLL